MGIKSSLTPPYRKKSKQTIIIKKNGEQKSLITPIGILTFIGVMIAFITLIFIFTEYFDSQIKKRINDPEFINKVASDIRPVLFFDANSTIHPDLGAGKYLVDKNPITVLPLNLHSKDYKIIIAPKTHLPYAPLIESVDNYEYIINVERSKGYQFIYELNQVKSLSVAPLPRFRLEILK